VKLSPQPFNMRNVVPENAIIEESTEKRWWRSDSPRAGYDEFADIPKDPVDISKSATRGVLGTGRRDGPICYQTSYQTGSGTAAHFKDVDAPATISGYSGFIAGKYAGNIVGGTFNKTNEDAETHLLSTAQAMRFGASALEAMGNGAQPGQ